MNTRLIFLSALLAFLGLTLLASDSAQAKVRLPALFTNHMVLQRDQPVPVWGWADPQEKVTVGFGGQTHSTTADAKGHWRVTLDPLSVGEARSLVVEGTNRVEIEDVLVGEVWICSGQSNMELSLSRANDGDLAVAGANYPEIRLFTVKMIGTQEPLDDVDSAWEVCSPKTAGRFSAVGYFFGQRLHQTVGVPIGLIHNSWGGSKAEAWVPREKLEGKSLYEKNLQQWDKLAADQAQDETLARMNFGIARALWRKKLEAALAAGKPVPSYPRSKHRLLGQHRPANLYNSRIAPLKPFAIQGAIWYQGESNASQPAEYRELFPLMVDTWREVWGQGDFAFYWVQLADFKAEAQKPSESSWAELREAQTMSLDRLSNSGQAVIIDLGEEKDIHPRNKRSVADRLARHALANQYGVQVPATSPRFQSLGIKGSKAMITLRDTGRGLRPFDVHGVRGFAIAGADQKWHWAEAKLVGGNKIEVTSQQVAKPVAVRYAWGDNPVCNLYSQSGLPVTPFRTDDW